MKLFAPSQQSIQESAREKDNIMTLGWRERKKSKIGKGEERIESNERQKETLIQNIEIISYCSESSPAP